MEMATITRSNIKIAPMAIVCKECDLIGDISIGARTIIHPKARIVAEAGPIIIGESNLIEEGVQIINKLPEDGSPTDETPVMVIGNHNVFEVASYVESLKIGNFNVVEVKGKTLIFSLHTHTHIYTQTHMHTYICIHTDTRTYTCTHTYMCIHRYTHIYTHTHAYMHTHTYTYTQTHTCTHIYVYTQIHTHIYIYIHTHAHPHTHIYWVILQIM
ncbi:Hypothetical predicted protein [Octopus vulgaris]|uniref:Dynactin subunit 6 n=1 Tax=Octopus vulgaris TaxID=6645 RepID=A0AA36BSS1_OCTVU|nr:Hypothetical predicted protein [Octopus vulgaris]